MVRGSKVRRWPLWVSLALLAQAVSGCQDGYPIAPTRCDEWCEATAHECWVETLGPASCVSACEQQGLGKEECSDAFDQALTCMHQKAATEFNCTSLGLTNEEPPCYEEQQALHFCGTPFNGGPAPQE